MKKLLFLIIMVLAMVSCSDNDEEKKKDGIVSITILDTKNGTILLSKNKTYQVKIETQPNDKAVKYLSENTNIFKVDPNGLITTVGIGRGTLSVLSADEDSDVKATCIIEVKELVETIEVNQKYQNYILAEGKDLDLTSVFTAFPESATDKKLTFKSSDPNIAKIDENGLIVPVSKGMVEISATAADGGGVEAKITIYSKYTSKTYPKTQWTVTASSYVTDNPPSNMLDGTATTYWMASAEGTVHWLLVDMKELKSFSKLKAYRSFLNPENTQVVEFYISSKTNDNIASDDSSFEKISTISFEGLSEDITQKEDLLFPNYKKTRYLKIVFPNTTTGIANNTLAEFYLYNIE